MGRDKLGQHLDKIGISGRLTITVDGESETYDNVITAEGKSVIMESLVNQDPSNVFSTIFLGRDVGTGSNLEPQEATSSLTGASQTVVYQIPVGDVVVTGSGNVRKFEVELNGADVLDGTGLNHHIYTSATLRTVGGKTIAYKRFRIRTITEATTFGLTWEITLT